MKNSSPMRGGRAPSSDHPNHRPARSARPLKENLEPPPTSPLPNSDTNNSHFRSPATKKRSPLPPRPPHSNPLKRKLPLPEHPSSASLPPDSGVKVVLRVRPPDGDEVEGQGEEEVERTLRQISHDTVSFIDHTFVFDAVADVESSQEDMYKLVGIPLVENCLAGFNSSIFAYGQTGSGKTYTMWGPANALMEDYSLSAKRGLTPRVFEQLFDRIKEEQVKQSGKQLNYQCRCSFLEIYNEQITDLLDPSQKNLQIREDVRTGVYVENLTEDFVCSMKDVTKLLIKGLENRRTGATNRNAESSRSHCVFTCIVEARSKCESDGLSSLRTSRINLVDLAGSERQKQTGAAGERLKEAGNINRSLSQLGIEPKYVLLFLHKKHGRKLRSPSISQYHPKPKQPSLSCRHHLQPADVNVFLFEWNLINILGEISQTGKQRHIPYRDSKLTFLLQDSLGGNAKLAMICAVSPSPSCRAETLGTLRFAQRAKAVKNKAVVNEVKEDDVNVLREQIRQLKDELLRMKSGSPGGNGSFSTGWNARRSLNILRQSLSRPINNAVMDDDNDEEMEIDEEGVEKSCIRIGSFAARCGEADNHAMNPESDIRCDIELTKNEHSTHNASNDSPDICMEVCDTDITVSNQLALQSESGSKNRCSSNYCIKTIRKTLGEISPNLLNVSNSDGSPCHCTIPCQSSQLEVTTTSVSPRNISNRKSLKTSLLHSASREDELSNGNSSFLEASLALALDGSPQSSSVRRSKVSPPTEHLAASLHHGLQILDLHQKKSPLRMSPFSVNPLEFKQLPPAKVDFGMQTLSEELDGSSEDKMEYICSYCKNKAPPLECKDVSVDTELQLVPIGPAHSAEKSAKQVSKAVEKVLAGAIRREMALEDHCAKQAAEIAHLNRLVQQYKHERECNVIIGQTREDKISRLEGLMDGIVPIEKYVDEEFSSLANEYKILQEKYENHPEVLRMNIELKRVKDELQAYKNFSDLGEKDILMEEIQDLRRQLQSYVDLPSAQSGTKVPVLQLMHKNDSSEAPPPPQDTCETVEECAERKFEEERCCWREAESKWISLSEELRVELESTRGLAERYKSELDYERKCMEELKEALQTAMQGHARTLDQFVELEEKHIQLLSRHRKIRDGIVDVKRAAAKAGVRGAESKFIDCLAAEISSLKAEREKERRYWKDENKALQCQLRDTAEAVQAAGELLVRLKESEEAIEIAQKRVSEAEKEAANAKQETENLKKKHEAEIQFLKQGPKEAQPQMARCDGDEAKYDGTESFSDQQWKLEFDSLYQGDCSDFSRGAEHHSWFDGYDRCNI